MFIVCRSPSWSSPAQGHREREMHFVAVTGSPGKIQCLGFQTFFPFQEKPLDSLQPPL